jgi:hypothetical protein
MSLSGGQLALARNVARKVAHRPHAEIAQVLNERLVLPTRAQLTAADVPAILD